MTTNTSRPLPQQISSDALRSVTFSRDSDGGIDENEVRRFLGVVAEDLRAREAEMDRLQAENKRLSEAPRPSPPDHAAIGAETVKLLSQAQLVADRTIGEAEQYAQDLVASARDQYHDILQRAEQAPLRAAVTKAGGEVAYAHEIPEVEYVRIVTGVVRQQLRSSLDILGKHIERLGQNLPGGDDDAPATLE